MADDVQRLEEENEAIRARIEEVQEKRRAGFGEGEDLSRAVSAYEENERLKQVLQSQEDVLAREEKVRESLLEDEEQVNEYGLPLDTPYTITDDGPIVSDPIVVDESAQEGDNAPRPPAAESDTDRATRLAEIASTVTDADGDDDYENKEN